MEDFQFAKACFQIALGRIARIRDDRDGVTALEYGLIAALIAVTILAAVKTVGNHLVNTFNYVGKQLPQ